MKKYLHIFLLVFLLWAHTALANTCAWVSGSTKNWNDPTAWTSCGSTFPQATDDATVSGTGTLTVNGTSGTPSLARGVNFTGFTGTLSGASTAVWNIGDPGGSGAGVFTVVSGMTFSMATGSVVNFVSTNTGNTITTGTKSMPSMTFNGTGGSWLLQDNFLAGATSTVDTLTAGTLDMNNHNLTVVSFLSLTGSTRVLNMGSGTLAVGFSGDTAPSFQVGNLASGLTINGNTSTFAPYFQLASITMGDQTYNNYTQNAAGAFNLTIHGTPTFNNFSATAPNVASSIALDGGITVGGTLTLAGNAFSQNTRLLLKSSAYGTRANLVANGTITASRLDVKDIAASGSANLDISAITGNSGDCGNNTGFTLTTPSTVFAVMTTSGNIDGLPWKTTSNGGVVARVPLCQDTGRFDASSFSGAGITVTLNDLRNGSFVFTGATNSPTFAVGSITNEEIYGNLTFISGMSLTGTGTLNFPGAGTQSITTAGKSIPWATVQDGPGTLQPADNFTSTNFLFQNGLGTFSTNGKAVAFSSYEFAGGTATLNSALTVTGTGKMDGSTVNATATVSNGTTFALSAGVLNLSSQINSTGAITLSGGTTNDTGNSGEYKGTTLSCTGGIHTLRKLTLSSTFAASATCAYTLPAGANGTYATSWNESNTGGSSTVNGTLVRASGSYTVSGNSCTFGD